MTVQGATSNMHGQLYCGHALSSSPVVSALGSESDDLGSSPSRGKALCPWDMRRKKMRALLLGLAKSIYYWGNLVNGCVTLTRSWNTSLIITKKLIKPDKLPSKFWEVSTSTIHPPMGKSGTNTLNISLSKFTMMDYLSSSICPAVAFCNQLCGKGRQTGKKFRVHMGPRKSGKFWNFIWNFWALESPGDLLNSSIKVFRIYFIRNFVGSREN